jgi:hypothetical protein
MSDADAAEDAASKRDIAVFGELAAALCVRQEAIVATERHGPHLVLLPAAPGSCSLLLREVASRDTLLPAPPCVSAPSGQVAGDAWNCALLDPLSVTRFNPNELGSAFGAADVLRAPPANVPGDTAVHQILRRVSFK